MQTLTRVLGGFLLAVAIVVSGWLSEAVTAQPQTFTVTVGGALPAGTNNIGDVDILTIAAGDNNIGNVDIASLPSVTIGTFPDNEPFNVAQINGVTPLMGAGNTGTGSLRVTIATDQAALTGLAVYVEDAAETAGANLSMAGTVRRDTAATSAGASGDNATLNTDAVGKLWVSGAFAEDAAHASADIGLVLLAKRTDSAASSAGTDGDYATLNSDSLGRLWVNCGTGCSGGTQYAEDAVHASGDTGTLALAVRRDTAASGNSADGDNASLNVDSTGRLWANVFGVTQAAATYLTVRLSDGTNFLTPGTDYTEDVASAGAETGPLMMTIRQDTPAGTSSADGDFANLKSDSVGRLWVNCGTGCSGGTQFAEDSASADGHVGTLAMARRTATPANTSGADLDYEVLQMSAGRLWTSTLVTDGTDTAQVTATSGGSLQVELGAALPAGSNTIGNLGTITTSVTPGTSAGHLGKAEDAAHADADTGVALLTRRIDTAASSAGTSADYATLNTDENGYVYTALGATNSGGATTLRYISAGATEDEHAVCTGACTLYSITVTNTNAAARHLKCENDTAANTAPGTDVPEFDLAIPGATTGAGFTTTFPVGASFGTALTCWIVTGAAESDVAEVAANELKVFYTFKQ